MMDNYILFLETILFLDMAYAFSCLLAYLLSLVKKDFTVNMF